MMLHRLVAHPLLDVGRLVLQFHFNFRSYLLLNIVDRVDKIAALRRFGAFRVFLGIIMIALLHQFRRLVDLRRRPLQHPEEVNLFELITNSTLMNFHRHIAGRIHPI